MGLYTGRGSYGGEVTHANNLVEHGGDMIHRSGVASFNGSMDETGAVVIKHREYIGDIFGPSSGVSFNVQSYVIESSIKYDVSFFVTDRTEF